MMMILLVIIMFFACHSVAMALRIVRIVPNTSFMVKDVGKFVSDLSNFLVSLSSAVNPLYRIPATLKELPRQPSLI